MSSKFNGFTKDSMDMYFSELAKELKKEFGRKAKFELIVVGGAAVLMNYSFRDSTQDIDAMTATRTSIKDAVNRTGDRLGLPDGWINSDFMQTDSYSPRLVQASRFHKTYSQVLEVRTVSAENLIAMKLMSMRPYKNDESDIIGIIHEQKKAGNPVTYESVKKAAATLYGKDRALDENAENMLKTALSAENAENLYEKTRRKEEMTGSELKHFEKKYPGVLNGQNLSSVLSSIQNRRKAGAGTKEPHKRRIPEVPEPVQEQDETEYGY